MAAAAGYVCVNVSTHVGSTLADCPRLFSDYAPTAYMGYCLPNDTTSSAWTALYSLVSNPEVSFLSKHMAPPGATSECLLLFMYVPLLAE